MTSYTYKARFTKSLSNMLCIKIKWNNNKTYILWVRGGNYWRALNVKHGTLKELVMLLSAVYVYTLLCSCFCAVERLVFIFLNCLITDDEYL